MKNEEIIDFCEMKSKAEPENKDVFNCIIKVLEQEPCEDCVSRKRLMDNYNGVETPVGYRKVVDFEVIKNMQPVRPTRKKGKWIKKESATGLELYYQCSNCGNHCLYEYVEIGFQNAKTKFCPNCGAEMDCVTLDDVFDNTVKEKTFEENVLIELVRDMPKEMGVLYIQSFQQEHGPFTDEAAEIIREYLSKE